MEIDPLSSCHGFFQMRTKPGTLTPKQSKFVVAYVNCHNATAAAIAAGYSPHTARSIGSENLQKREIKSAIEHGYRRLFAQILISSLPNRDWLLEVLIMSANADIADIHNRDGSFKPIHEWPLIFRTILVTDITIKPIKEINNGVITKSNKITKVKFIPRENIIKLIGKHKSILAFT